MKPRTRRGLAAGLDELLVLAPFAPVYAFVFGSRSHDMGDAVVLLGAIACAAAASLIVVALQSAALARRGGTIGMRAFDLAVDRGSEWRSIRAAALVHGVSAIAGVALMAALSDRAQLDALLAWPAIVVAPNLLGLTREGARTSSDRLARITARRVDCVALRGSLAAGLATDVALLVAFATVGSVMTAMGVFASGGLAWGAPLAAFVVLEGALVAAGRGTLGMCTWKRHAG